MGKKRIALISTGGTIEKVYDELQGVLTNELSVLDVMLAQLEQEGVQLTRIRLLNKDSLDMTDDDHALVAETVREHNEDRDGIVVVHGTDRLAITGERIVDDVPNLRVPVVLTGAMRPYLLRNTDAVQNLTEALLAVQLLSPGVYVAMHGRVLQFPGVVKDTRAGRFMRKEEIGRPDTRRMSRRLLTPKLDRKLREPSDDEES
jgi:L-asparaginase